MSRKANPAIIGAFIIGAAALTVTVIAFLASGALFGGYGTFVTYFSEPVNGLSVGAPVKYRGIPLGEVSRIGLYENPEGNDYAQVHYELEHRLLASLGGTDNKVSAENIERLVHEGLRARLEVESIVTGVVFVTLEFKTDAGPPDLVNPESNVVEIPSTLSPLSELTESAGEVIARLSNIDVTGISNNLVALTATLNEKLKDVELDTLADNLTASSARIRDLVSDPELSDLASDIQVTVREFRETNTMLRDMISGLEPTVGRIDSIAVHVGRAAVSMEAVSERTNEMLARDGEFRKSLEDALSESAAAMKSLRRLVDMLERNPRALIAGKSEDRK